MRARYTIIAIVVLLSALLPQTIFAAVTGQQASESNLGYLAGGVFAVWAAFFGYAFYLARKNSALRRDLEDLQREINSRR